MEDIVKKLCNLIVCASSSAALLILMLDAMTFESRTKYGENKNKMLFALGILFFVAVSAGAYAFKKIVGFL